MLAGLLMLPAGCIGDDVPESGSLVNVGDRLPHFEVEMSDGCRISSEVLVGKPSVVVLFSISCPDCRSYLPIVEAFHKARPDVPVVCIARNEDASTLSEYWGANGLTLPYSPQPDSKVYSMFATGGVPRTYVSDKSLTIVAEWGDRPLPSLEELLIAVAE